MNIKAAIIQSVSNEIFTKKILGLYPLERNIKVLWKSGIEKIFLDLNDSEKELYNKKLQKKMSRLKGITIDFLEKKPSEPAFEIKSNHFLQFHYFDDVDKYFSKKGKSYIPVENDEIFEIHTKEDIKNAENKSIRHIVSNTGGFLAQNVNKKISVPISRIMAKTGIHPNYLTFVNMVVGFLSAYFLLYNTYWMIVLGGLFFQLASVFDGVDGEVAKFTMKFSKFGSWLDTFSDNMTLILFLIASSYLYYINFGGMSSVIVISAMFVGLTMIISAMVAYLKKYSSSGSLVIYDKEFLQKIPEKNFILSIVLGAKYYTKKEFFALLFFLICFTGRIHLIIPAIALVTIVGALMLIYLNAKFFKLLPFKK